MIAPNTPELRSHHGELRAAGEDGVIEGYVAVWDTVDSYNSSFQRGAFAKTLQERGARVKVLWNHGEEVIGKPLLLREDDHGLFARLQLVMSVPKAREVFELVKAQAIDTFSFGFRTIKDKWVNGVRAITEVMLMEISPVIFEANSAAQITGVRAMIENRDVDYKKTYERYELGRRGTLILESLFRTLDDVWFSGAPDDQVREGVASAVSEFAGMYMSYTDELIALKQREARGTPVQHAIRQHLSETEQTPEQLAASTSLTIAEVRSMLDGRPAVDVAKLSELPEAVRAAITAERVAKVDALFAELRAGFEPAELDRLRGLLPQAEDPHATAVSALSQTLAQFRAGLNAH